MGTGFGADEEQADHDADGAWPPDGPTFAERLGERHRDDGLPGDDGHAMTGVAAPEGGGLAGGYPGSDSFAGLACGGGYPAYPGYPEYAEFVDPGDLADAAGPGEGEDFGWLGGPVGPAGLDDHNVLAGSDGSALDDFGDEASMVRPYAWTRGRTRSNYDLKLETLVSTTDGGQEAGLLSQVEHRSVSSLCRYPHSVAEVAAKLSIPLGVARVILSDMADLGLISIHRTFADDDVAAHLVFMERVLSGLRRL